MLKYGALFQISFKDFITPLGYNIVFNKMEESLNFGSINTSRELHEAHQRKIFFWVEVCIPKPFNGNKRYHMENEPTKKYSKTKYETK
jgi:hypothetical protein